MRAETQSHYFHPDTVWTEPVPDTELIIQQSIREQEIRNFETTQNKKFVQYELAFDMNRYDEIQKLKTVLAPELYEAKLSQAHEFTDLQLDTMLGERFNRGLSAIEYEVRDGGIYGKDADEPFLNVVTRGVEYCRMKGSSQEDQERERAEIDEFLNVQHILTNPETPVGTMVACISLPGSEASRYKHNFYDVWTKQSDGTIQMSRYSSARTADEYKEKLIHILPNQFPDQVDTLYFKQNQMIVDPKSTGIVDPDDLHAYLHERHELKDDRQMDLIVQATKQLQERYKLGLEKDPTNKRQHEVNFNLILHAAEMAARELSEGRGTDAVADKYHKNMDANTAYVLSNQHLEERLTPCGWSGRAGSNEDDISSGTSAMGPYNAASYGREKWAYTTGQCRVCRVENAEVGPCEICKGCEKMFKE